MDLSTTTETAADAGLEHVSRPVARAVDQITAAIEARQGDAALAAMEARPRVNPEIVAWVARCRLGKGMVYALDHGCRPGERVVAGKVHVYDNDALNAYLACEAVLDAPDDLSALTEDEVRSLRNRCGRVWAMEKGAAGIWDDLAMRCTRELNRRSA